MAFTIVGNGIAGAFQIGGDAELNLAGSPYNDVEDYGATFYMVDALSKVDMHEFILSLRCGRLQKGTTGSLLFTFIWKWSS